MEGTERVSWDQANRKIFELVIGKNSQNSVVGENRPLICLNKLVEKKLQKKVKTLIKKSTKNHNMKHKISNLPYFFTYFLL